MSTDRWIKKGGSVCVRIVEYYSATKKNEILPSATTQTDLEGLMLTEASQAERDKPCAISLTRGI